MSVASLTDSYLTALSCLRPRPLVSTLDWSVGNIRKLPEGKVKTYEPTLFPHCIEPLAAFDDPLIRIITLQWAAQTGKTAGLAMPAVAKTGAVNPHPMAWADADEKSTRRVMERLWSFFESIDCLAQQCPPKNRQSNSEMRLTTFKVHGAWAKSAATAADYGAYVVVLNEADKMKQFSTASESDFRFAMRDRTQGFSGAKIIQISTPSVRGRSFIESQRLAGDNRRRMVPCPLCNYFQILRTGNGRDPGGVKFDRVQTADGLRFDPQLARETAWYECEKCGGRIEEHHRHKMLNDGLWVPEGCHVRRGRVTGKPARPGNHASFGPLSALHSLLPGSSIGTYAEAFVQAMSPGDDSQERRRHWANSWEGETFDISPSTVQPDDVVVRMGTDEPLRICPLWSVFLTEGVDVGAIGEDLIFYWVVMAWGPNGRGQLVDIGVSWSINAYLNGEIDSLGLKQRYYPHADGGAPLRPVRIGMDSSSFTTDIYDLTRKIHGAWPIKGDSGRDTRNVPGWFTPSLQRAGVSPREIHAKIVTGNYDLILMNTFRTQDWIESRVNGRTKRNDPVFFSIPREALDGEVLPGVDLKKHLLGDVRTDRGWQKLYEEQHYRDAFRIGLTMAMHYTRNGEGFRTLAPRSNRTRLPTTQNADPAFRTILPEF